MTLPTCFDNIPRFNKPLTDDERLRILELITVALAGAWDIIDPTISGPSNG
jgi:hypothetical protein